MSFNQLLDDVKFVHSGDEEAYLNSLESNAREFLQTKTQALARIKDDKLEADKWLRTQLKNVNIDPDIKFETEELRSEELIANEMMYIAEGMNSLSETHLAHLERTAAVDEFIKDQTTNMKQAQERRKLMHEQHMEAIKTVRELEAQLQALNEQAKINKLDAISSGSTLSRMSQRVEEVMKDVADYYLDPKNKLTMDLDKVYTREYNSGDIARDGADRANNRFKDKLNSHNYRKQAIIEKLTAYKDAASAEEDPLKKRSIQEQIDLEFLNYKATRYQEQGKKQAFEIANKELIEAAFRVFQTDILIEKSGGKMDYSTNFPFLRNLKPEESIEAVGLSHARAAIASLNEQAIIKDNRENAVVQSKLQIDKTEESIELAHKELNKTLLEVNKVDGNINKIEDRLKVASQASITFKAQEEKWAKERIGEHEVGFAKPLKQAPVDSSELFKPKIDAPDEINQVLVNKMKLEEITSGKIDKVIEVSPEFVADIKALAESHIKDVGDLKAGFDEEGFDDAKDFDKNIVGTFDMADRDRASQARQDLLQAYLKERDKTLGIALEVQDELIDQYEDTKQRLSDLEDRHQQLLRTIAQSPKMQAPSRMKTAADDMTRSKMREISEIYQTSNKDMREHYLANNRKQGKDLAVSKIDERAKFGAVLRKIGAEGLADKIQKVDLKVVDVETKMFALRERRDDLGRALKSQDDDLVKSRISTEIDIETSQYQLERARESNQGITEALNNRDSYVEIAARQDLALSDKGVHIDFNSSKPFVKQGEHPQAQAFKQALAGIDEFRKDFNESVKLEKMNMETIKVNTELHGERRNVTELKDRLKQAEETKVKLQGDEPVEIIRRNANWVNQTINDKALGDEDWQNRITHEGKIKFHQELLQLGNLVDPVKVKLQTELESYHVVALEMDEDLKRKNKPLDLSDNDKKINRPVSRAI